MTDYTFTYISSDTPDRTFKSHFVAESMEEALRKFYDFCTSFDDETLTILDIDSVPCDENPDRTMPECDDDPYYRECRAATSGDDISKADLIDFYSRFPETMEDW